MPQRTALWTISADAPSALVETQLASEQLLEDMIVAAPRILSDEWMLIGQQERTASGRLDLLGIAPDGALILIELKRGRTPRDVVAQALDYAAWVEQLKAEDIAGIYRRFSQGGDLANDFRNRFGLALDEDTLNDTHQIVIVATDLDDGSERIVKYLGEKGIAINVLCFQVFARGEQRLLARTWLVDPIEAQVSAATPTSAGPREREPWNGEFYASFGNGPTRDWGEARRYGFICGGGGAWYSNTLRLLSPDDRVWVKAPGYGFVGVGEVTGPREPIDDFMLATPEGDRRAADLLTAASYHRDEDADRREYFVPVRWLHSVPLEEAVNEVGLFGNQNTVCKPTTPKWRTTVERLAHRWGVPAR